MMMSLFTSFGMIVSFLTFVQSGQSPKHFYELGLAQSKVGKWEQALKTWWDGSVTLEADGLADPRIGVAFIELATEMQASTYYKRACDLYFKSLSSDGSKEYAETVAQQFLSIANLLEDEEFEALNIALNRGEVSAVAERIKRFWQEKNQPPSTQGNQKLLLHWLRIAYARQNFTKSRDSVHGTDDRGVVYIMNGEPAKKHWGQIHPKWRDGTLAIGTNSTVEFEAWIYRNTESNTSIIFMFGKGGDVDSYRIVSGVQDFISDFNPAEVGHVDLLVTYYSQLTDVHPYFEARHSELQAILDRASDGTLLGANDELTNFLTTQASTVETRGDNQGFGRLGNIGSDRTNRAPQEGTQRGSRKAGTDERVKIKPN